MQHHHDLGQRIDRQPEPTRLCPLPEAGTQFVKLDVREVETLSDAVVQGRAVYSSPCQPGGDSRVAMPEHPQGRGHTQPFRQRREHFRNPLR
jgi:hypothetical protein